MSALLIIVLSRSCVQISCRCLLNSDEPFPGDTILRTLIDCMKMIDYSNPKTAYASGMEGGLDIHGFALYLPSCIPH